MADLPDYITTGDVAEQLGCGYGAVQRLYKRGTLAGVWVGGRLMFSRRAVVALLNDEGYLFRSRVKRERSMKLDFEEVQADVKKS
jgi:excisionase family DNA binding protein